MYEIYITKGCIKKKLGLFFFYVEMLANPKKTAHVEALDLNLLVVA